MHFQSFQSTRVFGLKDENIHTIGVAKDYLHVQNLPRKPLKFSPRQGHDLTVASPCDDSKPYTLVK